MDRARRAEPYSNATIWTREIARNLAGHLDRLSKAHSCVDSASPKWTAHPSSHIKHARRPRKTVGLVSPLKHGRSASAASTPTEDRDDNEHQRDETVDELATARDEHDPLKCTTPGRRRPRPEALKKIKTVTRRTQLEAYRQGEPQRTQDRPMEPTGSHYEFLESPQSSANSKKHAALDYHRRQEQQRIWEENQKLAKRLRNTKPTLKSKDWEKDDKWNQSFLKTQERRRQALHHEMARTLASPHSATIRVKPIVHPGGHMTSRPHTEYGLGDEPVTAIEVTAPDTKIASSGRDLRRRQSVDEDMAQENRHHSTAPSHRRILELRKQKEQGERRQHPQTSTENDGPTSDTGPPDELVSVRFTFSRGHTRTPCTPNGITGQFSPAVELEVALETSNHDDHGDDDTLLLPVPELHLPDSSPLDAREHDEVSGDVFDALQACIDMVVLMADQTLVVEDNALELPSAVHAQAFEEVLLASTSGETPQEKLLTEAPDESTKEPRVPSETPAHELDPSSEALELYVEQEEENRQQDPEPAAENVIAPQPDLPDTPQLADDTETLAASNQQVPPTVEMEVSTYASEFDGEESMTAIACSGRDAERALELQPLPEQQEEPEENEYEDDHVDADDEPQYDDDEDLESETDHGANDDEHLYDDDGFAEDDA